MPGLLNNLMNAISADSTAEAAATATMAAPVPTGVGQNSSKHTAFEQLKELSTSKAASKTTKTAFPEKPAADDHADAAKDADAADGAHEKKPPS